MKNQRKIISSKIEETFSNEPLIALGEQQNQVDSISNVNVAIENINNNSYSDFTKNKREREEMSIAGTGPEFIKKQKIENPMGYPASSVVDPYANILNNHNNSLTSLTNNQPSTFNIINNNPHPGNLNSNLGVSSYMNQQAYQSKNNFQNNLKF